MYICYELCKKLYCEWCLVKLQKGSDITCPECRKTSGMIKQLPNNFFINRIVDEVALKEKITGEEEVHCRLTPHAMPCILPT